MAPKKSGLSFRFRDLIIPKQSSVTSEPKGQPSVKTELKSINNDLRNHEILLNDEEDEAVRDSSGGSLDEIAIQVLKLQEEVHAMNPFVYMKPTTRARLRIDVQKLKDNLVEWKVTYSALSETARNKATASIINDTAQEVAEEFQIKELIQSLMDTLDDPDRRDEIYECRTTQPQQLINFFQWLLDNKGLDPLPKRKLIGATKTLARRHYVYPECYLLDLEGMVYEKNPVDNGGFADIYKGTYQDKVVALKVLKSREQPSKFLKEFPREAIIWAQLSHPNLHSISGLCAFGESRQLCFVSLWQENGDVNTFLKNNPDENRVRLAFEIASGLAYLEENKVIHGDLRGKNVLVDRQGRALLADFGLSIILDSPNAAQSLTVQAAGNPRWMAPEIFMTAPEIHAASKKSHASDVYAWSMVCIEVQKLSHNSGDLPLNLVQMHTDGRQPFELMTKFNEGLYWLIGTGTRPGRPGEEPGDNAFHSVSDELWKLMRECWNTDPKLRPSTNQLMTRLACMLPDEPSRPTESSDDTSQRLRREKMKGVLNADYVHRVLSGLLRTGSPEPVSSND